MESSGGGRQYQRCAAVVEYIIIYEKYILFILS